MENTGKLHHLDHIYSSIESPFLGFCYDSSHDFLGAPELGEILSKWGHLLVATHLSDNDGVTDKHWIPKEGIIDWGIIGDSFPKDAYTGFFTLEVLPQAGREGRAISGKGFPKHIVGKITFDVRSARNLLI